MKIKEVIVTNFRSLKQASLGCGSVTTLVGRNGAGKSAFLQALDLFYRPQSSVTLEDFHNRDTSSPIILTVVFHELRPVEQEAFSPYIDQDRLVVTKKYELPDPTATAQGKYFANKHRYPPFVTLDSIVGATDKRNALIVIIDSLITDGILPPDTSKPRTVAQVTEFIASFEEGHADLLVPTESETQFFGDKNVGGGKLDRFTQFVYVPAVRDAQQDTTDKKSSFAQLLEIVVLRKVNARQEVMDLRATLQEKVNEVFSGATLSADLRQLESDLNATLHPFVPSASIALDIGTPPRATFDPPVILPLVDEDNFKGEVGRKGHGLQRAIILTLLTQLQNAKNAERTSGAAGESSEPELILGIEEPELYQHPQRCRHFAKVLRGLAEVDGRTQVLQTTHSPLFVSLDHFDEVRVLRKEPGEPGQPAHSILSQVDVEVLREKWATHTGIPLAAVTVPSLFARVGRSMTNTVNEGFFADAVVLVEGAGDVGLLTTVADKLGKEWPAKGITVVPVNGKMNLTAPALIFSLLGIPTYFVFDGDERHRGVRDKEPQTKRINQHLLTLGAATPVDFPVAQVGERFACFSDSPEQYCAGVLGADHGTITVEIASEIGWSDPVDVLNNLRGSEEFIGRVYGAGKSLPLLEEMVTKISGLID